MSMPVITKVSDLSKLFAHFSIREYHIGFDRSGKVVVNVNPEYYAKTTKIIFAYAPIIIQENIKVIKMTKWRMFKNAFIRFCMGCA